MAKLKLKRYPRKPKSNASVTTLQNYLDRCKEIDKENARRKQQNAKLETLRKRVSGLRQKL